MDQRGITWVPRLNKGARWECQEERLVSEKMVSHGVRRDRYIWLGNPQTANKVPLQPARLITYYDQQTGKEFEFLTNNRELIR